MTRYRFAQWVDELGNVVGTTPSLSLLIDRDRTLTAHYEQVPVPQYTLSIATTIGGTTNPAPGNYSHPEGTSVSVTAIPSSGYAFDHWILDAATRTENPITIMMDKNHTLTAYFTKIPVYYTLTIGTTVGGTTNPAPGTYTCLEGTTVQVQAIPSSGYNFDHWILDGTMYTSNPISVLMNRNQNLTAYFSEIPPPPPETYKLNVASTVYGTTNPTPGIYTHNAGSSVVVTAIPEAGYCFDHWQMDGAVRTENPINVLMDRDHTLLAVFSEVPPKPPPSLAGWSILSIVVAGAVIGYLILKKK